MRSSYDVISEARPRKKLVGGRNAATAWDRSDSLVVGRELFSEPACNSRELSPGHLESIRQTQATKLRIGIPTHHQSVLVTAGSSSMIAGMGAALIGPPAL